MYTKLNKWFSDTASYIADQSGKPLAFSLAICSVVIWLLTGPIFDYSDTWQLVINTGTTIITFLMVFLIQNTQNRDGAAVQIKLDELIRAHEGAHNALLDLEKLSEENLILIRDRYEKLAALARLQLDKGGLDTDTGDV